MTGSAWPRAITIRQPWATAIARHGKDVENRTWATNYRGTLYVHAGRLFEPHAGNLPQLRATFGTGDRPVRWPDLPPTHRSAIIAVAQLTDVHRSDSCCAPWGQPNAGEDPTFHWVLQDVTELTEPVPMVGGLGLRYPTRQVRAAVEAALPVKEDA